MTGVFDRILNFCLLAAFLGLVVVFACDPPTKEIEPGITDVEWEGEAIDPNWLAVPVGIMRMFDIRTPDDRICSVSPEWQMQRGEAHRDKSCDEYAKLLTGTIREFGFTRADFISFLALCWLMDPCSKGEP